MLYPTQEYYSLPERPLALSPSSRKQDSGQHVMRFGILDGAHSTPMTCRDIAHNKSAGSPAVVPATAKEHSMERNVPECYAQTVCAYTALISVPQVYQGLARMDDAHLRQIYL